MTPAPTAGPAGRGLIEIASFGLGDQTFGVLALVLYLPLVAALLLARAWRLTWAIRSAALVVAFGALALLSDHGTIAGALPEVGVLLVPVALGVSVGAAAALAAFDLDVRGSGFGWRQPAGILAGMAVAVGVVPGILSIGDGSWSMEETPLAGVMENQLAPQPEEGDGRVLLIGDPRVLPVPGHEVTDGVAYAVIGRGALDVRDRWITPEGAGDDRVLSVLQLMKDGETVRAGRLLGILGIRDIVVPRVDNTYSTSAAPLPVPAGLIEAFEDQLDLALTFSPPSVEIFENRGALPVGALLTGPSADAIDATDNGALVRADLSSVTPAFIGAAEGEAETDDVDAGVVHLATPLDDHWRLTIGGAEREAREAFGLTTAFEAEAPGTAELAYETDGSRRTLLFALAGMWLLVTLAASRARGPFGRRRGAVDDTTLLDLDEDPGGDVPLDDVLALDDPGGWISEVLEASDDERGRR